jgi:predicted permease
MTDPNIVFGSALCIIAIGYALKSAGFIQEHDGKSISKFLMHTTFPALVFSTMIRVNITWDLIYLPLIAMLFGMLLSFSAFHLFKQVEPENRGVMTIGSAGFNLGIFAYPLIEGIFGIQGLTYAIMFDLGNSVVNFFVNYGMGNYFSKGPKNENLAAHIIVKRVISLPPLQAMVLGVLVNVIGIKFPTFALDLISTIASGNKSIVLLLMGIYFSVRLSKKSYFRVFQVLSMRYSMGFLVGGLCFYLLPFDLGFRNLLLLCLILPVGMTVITYSDELNLNTPLAASLVNISLVISFVIMWIMVSVFHMSAI